MKHSLLALAFLTMTTGDNHTVPAEAPVDHFCLDSFPPEQCSLSSVCGRSSREKKYIGDKTHVCVVFESDSESGGGEPQKAVFYASVDKYSRFRVTSLINKVGSGNWSEMAPYSHMWLASEGHRTVGQAEGIVTNVEGNNFNCTPAAEGDVFLPDKDCGNPKVGCKCYGWINHSKPTLRPYTAQLVTALTAIIHMDQGIVTHIAWDSQCNLCRRQYDATVGAMQCHPDGTHAVCTNQDGWSGISSSNAEACQDCYVLLDPASCNDASCAPTVYVAWEGTDGHGMPLLSSGGILSRFQQYSLQGVYDDLKDEVLDVSN